MRFRTAVILAVALGAALGVPSSARGGYAVAGSLVDVLGTELGFSEHQIDRVLDTSWPLDAADRASYRSSRDLSAPPTLAEDAATVTPVQIGAHLVAWDDPSSLPDLPSDGVVRRGGGGLLAGTGGGIEPLATYLVAHAVFPAELPTPQPDRVVDYAILLEVPGYEPWGPDPAFPFDPRSGATHAVVLGHARGSWELTPSELSHGGRRRVEASGFAIVEGNVLVIGVDTAGLIGFDPEHGFGYGYAGHAHDGRFGACAGCPSRITTVPGFPRDGLPHVSGPLIKPGFDPHYDVAAVAAVDGPDGFVWLDLVPVSPWEGMAMPTDFFSQFFRFGIAIPDDQAGAYFGVQQHDGQLTSFGAGPDGDLESRIYAMSDGSVLARTNFTSEQAADGIDVTFEGGYLAEQGGAFTSITRRFHIRPAELMEGDPLTHDGAHAVFDFSTLRPVPSLADDTCWWCWSIAVVLIAVPTGWYLLRRTAGHRRATDS